MSKSYQQGDIVLIPYPFDDLSGTKRRPVIVVSQNNRFNEFSIVAKITSVLRGDADSFLLRTDDLNVALSKTSEVRTNHVFTAHDSLVIKKIGRLQKTALVRLTNQVKTNFDCL